jgi:hypothetical protein
MNAIEPYRGSSGGKLVQYVHDGVAADVLLRRVDRRNRTAAYEIRLVTQRSDLTARLVGVDPRGTAVELGVVVVGSGSIGASRFSVPLPGKGRGFTDVYLELRADDLMLNVAAPAPPPKTGHRAFRIGMALVALGATAAAGSGLAFALPDTPSLAAPSRAVAGEFVHLGYATRGFGSSRYVVTSDDGSTVAAADLHAPHGEIAFALPASSAHHNVSVALSTTGVFGTIVRNAAIAVVAPPPTRTGSVARVAAFSARREMYGNGESILASYLAVADDGELTVRDRAGHVVARAPFARRGTDRIAIPDAVQSQPLSVRLDVRYGASRAMAMVDTQPISDPQSIIDSAVPAAPVTQPAPAADEVPEAVVPVDDQSSASGDEPFSIAGTPTAGHPLKISIRRFVSGMRFRLADDAGLVIDEVAVTDSSRIVSLRTPPSLDARTYYLTCSYGSGAGEETLVRSVRVAAH